MTTETKCRKPKTLKFFGIAGDYDRYSNRWYKWQALLPNDDDKIRIRWLSPCRNGKGTMNPYIGMEGVVNYIDKLEGSFSLICKTCSLIVSGDKFNYINI